VLFFGCNCWFCRSGRSVPCASRESLVCIVSSTRQVSRVKSKVQVQAPNAGAAYTRVCAYAVVLRITREARFIWALPTAYHTASLRDFVASRYAKNQVAIIMVLEESKRVAARRMSLRSSFEE
jgi:hypothetical protein